jgi:hypothetical protein
MWYIHVITSNVNWMYTALSHLACTVFFMTAYIVNGPQSENKPTTLPLKIQMVVVMGFVSLVYLWLAYHTDSQRKYNFLNTYALKQVSLQCIHCSKGYPSVIPV